MISEARGEAALVTEKRNEHVLGKATREGYADSAKRAYAMASFFDKEKAVRHPLRLGQESQIIKPEAWNLILCPALNLEQWLCDVFGQELRWPDICAPREGAGSSWRGRHG
jgi:hypothetical protein